MYELTQMFHVLKSITLLVMQYLLFKNNFSTLPSYGIDCVKNNQGNKTRESEGIHQ